MSVNLGFTPQELQYASTIYNNAGGWLPKMAQFVMGQDYWNMQDIVKYCIKLKEDELFNDSLSYLTANPVFDDTPQEEIDVVARHFAKMHKTFNRGIQFYNTNDFTSLGQRSVIAYIVLRNLKAPFDIYNQGHFIDGSDKYELLKKGGKKSKFITKRHPYAEKEKDLDSDQAKIVKSEDREGYYEIEVDNENIGLLNRFAVIISIKPPASHCGMSVTLNGAGNKIYIYALEFNADVISDKKLINKAGQWSNSAIVLGYGFKKSELESTLKKATEYIKQKCDGRLSILVRPEHDFEEKTNWFKETAEDMEVNWGGDFNTETNLGTSANEVDPFNLGANDNQNLDNGF